MTTATPSPDPERPASTERAKSRGRWAKIAAWTVGGLAVLMLLAIATVAVLLHSTRFHRYLLALTEKKATTALGAQVELQDFALHLSSLSLDVYGVTVHGAEPYRNPPLLQVEHAEVGVRIVSIWSKEWYLNNIRVDRPIVRIFVGANGVSNIPKPKNSGGGGHINVFKLGIRRAVLENGEIYYNDKKSILEADLHDVDFRSSFNDLLQKYSGTLSYRDGHLRTNDFSPVSHDLEAEFDATPNMFHLTHAKLTSGPSQLTLVATLKDYSHPNIEGHYDAVLHGSDIRHVLHNPPLPTGVIRTSGSVEYQYRPDRSAIDTVVLQGDLSSRRLHLQAPKYRAQLDDIAAQYSLADGDVTVRNLRARFLGGELTATLNMRNIAGASQSKLSASLRGVSLRELKQMVPASRAVQGLTLSGILNANANAVWGKTFDDLVASMDATIHASMSRVGYREASPGEVPVDGVIHGKYSAATEQLALSQSYFRTPQTTLTMNGSVSTTGGNRTGLAIHLKSDDLRELETVADIFRSLQSGGSVQPLGLMGTASFEGVVRGPVTAPHLTGQLIASNLQVKGTKWRVLRTDVELNPSLISLQHADLEPAPHGRIAFNANARLAKWSFTKDSPVQIELHASQIDIANLEKVVGLKMPIEGTLVADVSAHGTVFNPIGQGRVSLAQSKIYEEPVQSANIVFTGAGDRVHGKLTIHAAAGTVEGGVSVQPKQKSYVAQLTANGIHLDQLQVLKAHNLDVKGLLDLHGNGQGTWDNPQFNATVQIPQLEIQDQSIQGIALEMNVANHVATANLNSNFVNNVIKVTVKVNLSGDYFTEAMLDSQAIPLQPLLAMYAPSEAAGVTGETEIHATLQGPLKNRKLLEAHATLPTLKLAYGTAVQMSAASPVHIDYKNGVVDLQRVAIRGTDTDLQVQGSVPVASSAHLSLLLLGTVNLKLAQLFNPDIRSSGELRFNINSYGANADSNVEGQVEIVNANFTNGNLPIGLQRGNGVLTLTKDRLNIQSFKATVGGGTLTAQGGVAYRPSIQFDLGATAKGIRMLYPQGVREELDADLRLAGTTDNALLGGRVRLQNLSFTPSFDLMNFVGQLSSGVTPPPAQGFSQNLQLNLAVSSINNLNLVSRTLSVDGTANLQVRGTAAQPVILGRINLNDGDLIFNGTRFTLGGGTIEFINPAETQPVVNLALNTTIQQYNIHLRFNGPVDQLHTNYASDPSLPAADIINLLAFGQTTEAGVANPTPGNQAAMSLVASQVSSQITSRVAKIAGISQLSINPVLAGGSTQGPAGAIVTIQQRVTGNLFVTFSTNVTSTQSQVIMGQYRLSPRVSVSATRDQNGGFGFDAIFKKSW